MSAAKNRLDRGLPMGARLVARTIAVGFVPDAKIIRPIQDVFFERSGKNAKWGESEKLDLPIDVALQSSTLQMVFVKTSSGKLPE